jgi:hypothetical protein
MGIRMGKINPTLAIGSKMKIVTPEQKMIDVEWNENVLTKAKNFLEEWDKRGNDYYKEHKVSTLTKKVDLAEREHYRNCVNFWEKRLKNENQSS